MLIITIAPMKKITAARTDSSDLPVVASGPFVSHRDLRELYENATVDLVFLDGVLSSGRLDALENGAPLTASEKALLVRRRLKMFFDEPVADDAYVIKSLATAAGHKVFRAETRSWRRGEGVQTNFVGLFSTLQEAKAAVRRKGLIDVRDYKWRQRHSRR